ncbi:MAG: SHOCT domain-containing protein [Actinomycetota bacterium]|nr:SHOCT domain-containing protein [Actinomycetota bacterium]
MWWNNGVGWGGMGGGGWVVMTVVMVAFMALVVVVVVALLRRGRTIGVSGSGRTPLPSAEKVLDERFASGEIDAEEYQTRRTALRTTPRR